MTSDLRRVFHGKAELLQVAAKLFDALIIALNGVGRELAELGGDPLGLGDLSGPHARPFLVKDVLQLDGKNFAVLIELLGANVRDRVRVQEWQLLEGVLVVLVVEHLQHRAVPLLDHPYRDLLPEALARYSLLVGVAQLHLPALARVMDARKVLQRLARVLVKERRRGRFLREKDQEDYYKDMTTTSLDSIRRMAAITSQPTCDSLRANPCVWPMSRGKMTASSRAVIDLSKGLNRDAASAFAALFGGGASAGTAAAPPSPSTNSSSPSLALQSREIHTCYIRLRGIININISAAAHIIT